MAGKDAAREKAKIAKKFAQLYKAATDLSVAVQDVTGQAEVIELRLEDDSFTAKAGAIRFGAKQRGI